MTLKLFLKIFFIIFITSQLKVDSASFYSKFKVENSVQPRNGFAQVSVWGNSSVPPIFNSFLNSSSLPAGVASDSIDGNIPPPLGLPNDFGFIKPMKAYQKFKNFNLRLGHFFHLQGIGAVYHHQVFH